MKKTGFYCFLLAALAGGCKKSETSLTYYLTPVLQDEQNGPGEATQLLVGYYFATDSIEWMVDSYDHAVAGVLTRKDGGSETLPSSQQAAFDEQGRLVFGPFMQGPVTVVVATVDPDDDPDDPRMRIYAFRTVEVVENLPELYVTLWFRPWKTVADYRIGYYDLPYRYYTESNWKIFNENPPPVPAPEPDPDPDPDQPEPDPGPDQPEP